MTQLTSFRGHELLVQISDDGGTTFAHPAIINSNRSLSFIQETESDELIDTTDQSAPAQMDRFVRATDFKVDGSGIAQKGQIQYWADWVLSGASKHVKVIADDATFTCEMIPTSFSIGADRGKYAEFTVTLELSAGGVTVTTTA